MELDDDVVGDMVEVFSMEVGVVEVYSMEVGVVVVDLVEVRVEEDVVEEDE